MPDDKVAQLQGRLSRLEGHVRAINRMLEEGRDCHSLLVQVAAVKSAINQVMAKLLEGYLESCLASGEVQAGEPLEQLKSALGVALKFS